MKIEQIKEYMQIGMILLAIITLGWLAANQVQEYIYNAELLMYPCDLCVELNPELEECIKIDITNGDTLPINISDELLSFNSHE